MGFRVQVAPYNSHQIAHHASDYCPNQVDGWIDVGHIVGDETRELRSDTGREQRMMMLDLVSGLFKCLNICSRGQNI
jgi:hypothetical protein